MNGPALFPVLVASVLGSVHCAAMCGGFVAAYSGTESAPGRRAASHVAYHGGRLVTYAVLGALSGALGRALDLAGRAAGLADMAGVVAGVVLLVTGAAGLAPRSRLVRLRARPAWSPTRKLGALLARLGSTAATTRAALLGLTSTLLPCGWLYAFVALSAATGSAKDGVLLMATFWLGTLPMLLGVGMSLGLAARRFGGRLPRLRSALVLLVGGLTLFTRLQLPAFAATTHPTVPSVGARVPAAYCGTPRKGSELPTMTAPLGASSSGTRAP